MAEITVTKPASGFTITKPNSSFTVTTPEAQTIQVGENAPSISVVNQPYNVTITTGGIQPGGTEFVIDSTVYFDSATLTTTATTANQVIDSWLTTAYRSCKYQVQITSGAAYQTVEILVVHNGTTASQTTYADVATGSNLAAFAVDISSGSVRLLTTPVNAATVYKVLRTAIAV